MDGVGGDRHNKAKTHCPHGHPYTPENTLVSPQGWRKCKTCTRARERAYEKGTKRHDSRLRRMYGITYEEFLALAKAQKFRCGVCKRKCVLRGTRSQADLLVVDHCHKTGKVRGLLCHRCNKVIGMCNDDPKMLRAMMEWCIPIHREKATV